jgi:major membrane immunogen (membrane-anchored lipoprotein)
MTQIGLAIRVGDNYAPSAGMTQSRFNAFPLSLARARHRGLATLAGVLLALVVAGCGSSSGGQLSKADYQKHLRTDGDEITKAFKPLTQQPSSLDQLASELGTGVSKLRSAADDLDGVKPPKNVAKDNAKLAGGLRELARELDSLKNAAQKKDPQLVDKTLNDLRKSHGLIDARQATDDLRKKGYTLGTVPQ